MIDHPKTDKKFLASPAMLAQDYSFGGCFRVLTQPPSTFLR
jgi:hypothetical protein